MAKKKLPPIKVAHPGSMDALAKKAGETPDQWAEQHKDAAGVDGKKARYYLNVLKTAHKAKHR